MFESLIITLREGIEAALIIGIIVAYLRKSGQERFNRYIYWGVLLAILFSIGGGIVFQGLEIDLENEFAEGLLMFTAAGFVLSVVIWMWRAGRHIQRRLEEKVGAIVSHHREVWRGVGLGALTFFMVAREGIETVLFFGALSLSTTVDTPAAMVFRLTGGLVGIGMAVLFAVFFIRGSLRIDLKKFFSITGLILGLLAIRLFAGGVHEWGEVQIIPLTPYWMKIIGWVVRDASTIVISMILLSIPILMVLMGTGEKGEASPSSLSTAERRKIRAGFQRQRIWKWGVIGSAVLINAVLAGSLVGAITRPMLDPDPVVVAPSEKTSEARLEAGTIQIPVALLEGGTIQKFSYPLEKGNVRFLLIQDQSGTIRGGLDACSLCGDYGYYQEKGHTANIVCKNCDAPITISTIGMQGGCNPIGLPVAVQKNQAVIELQELIEIAKQQGDKIF